MGAKGEGIKQVNPQTLIDTENSMAITGGKGGGGGRRG